MLWSGAQTSFFVHTHPTLELFKELKPFPNGKSCWMDAQEIVRHTGNSAVGIRKWVRSRFVSRSDERQYTRRVSTLFSKENFHFSGLSHNVTEVDEGDEDCLYVKRSVKSGELVQHLGSVIVFGDVNCGGTVVSGKDIVILGKIYGKAHAGRTGHRNSSILAFRVEPCGVLSIHDRELAFEAGIQSKPHIVSLGDDGTIRRNAIPLAENLHKGELMRSKFASRPTKIAFFTGAYISGVGLATIFFPKSVFGFFFDLQTISVVWIKVLGTLAVVFGLYYIGTALGDLHIKSGSYPFYMSTVVGRLFLFASFCWIVVRHGAPLSLFYLGAINLFGALLMLRALQQSNLQGS